MVQGRLGCLLQTAWPLPMTELGAMASPGRANVAPSQHAAA